MLFCSEAFRREVLPGESSLNERSAVVLNGIELDGLTSRSDAASSVNSIVCVAHLREHKGQDVLLRAFHQIAEEFPGLTLHFVGAGPYAPVLESLTRELNLNGRVRYLGNLPRPEALREIASARIFCLPSRREPFGLVLLEAMAFGVPVVATRVGGIPEIIRSGVDGLLVEPNSPSQLAETLRRVLRDPSLSQKLVREAKVRVESHFGVARFFSDYRQMFQNLINLQDDRSTRAV
jgi:glycosyltransferase involved in cell wall biosynthesis